VLKIKDYQAVKLEEQVKYRDELLNKAQKAFKTANLNLELKDNRIETIEEIYK